MHQINVGGGNNDLLDFIKNHRVSKKKYDADYSKLITDPEESYGYCGDSQNRQYVLWTKENEIEKINKPSEKGLE